MVPYISLEQWRALIEVVDAGGYAQAAVKLCKSQSAVSYAVQQIETRLGVKAFEVKGRKAELTPIGHMLYRRAQALVEEAGRLEQAAHAVSAGWESVVTLAAEILFPSRLLLACLHRFGQESPATRVELVESVLGGTAEALHSGSVDLVISPQLYPGVLGNLLTRIRLQAVAHHDHPLHRLGRPLTGRDLRHHRHIVVRDSGLRRDSRAVSMEIDQRWTVSQIATSIQAVSLGYGFAWLPEAQIRDELASGLLKPLPLREGNLREAPLYLIFANPDCTGPAVKRLAELLCEVVAENPD